MLSFSLVYLAINLNSKFGFNLLRKRIFLFDYYYILTNHIRKTIYNFVKICYSSNDLSLFGYSILKLFSIKVFIFYSKNHDSINFIFIFVVFFIFALLTNNIYTLIFLFQLDFFLIYFYLSLNLRLFLWRNLHPHHLSPTINIYFYIIILISIFIFYFAFSRITLLYIIKFKNILYHLY